MRASHHAASRGSLGGMTKREGAIELRDLALKVMTAHGAWQPVRSGEHLLRFSYRGNHAKTGAHKFPFILRRFFESIHSLLMRRNLTSAQIGGAPTLCIDLAL
jgi:hypothetical protein